MTDSEFAVAWQAHTDGLRVGAQRHAEEVARAWYGVDSGPMTAAQQGRYKREMEEVDRVAEARAQTMRRVNADLTAWYNEAGGWKRYVRVAE